MSSTNLPQSQARGRVSWWRRNRFTVLLAVLVVDILIAPAISTIQSPQYPRFGVGLALLSLTALIVAAMVATSHGRATWWIASLIGLPAIALSWLDLLVDSAILLVVDEAFTLAFLAFVFVLLVRHVYGERRVTLDVISASLCAYLLLGLGWSSAYALIEIWQPGSFHLPADGFAAFGGHEIDATVRRVYFSFVTLLTLGYGDLVPMGSIARLSAVIEAFAGQVFLVVLIARLVGIQVGQEMSAPSSSET